MPNATPEPNVMAMNQVNPLTISWLWNPTWRYGQAIGVEPRKPMRKPKNADRSVMAFRRRE